MFSFQKSALILLAATPLLATAVDYAAEGKLWWAHIQFLADDKLQGRNIGTPEFGQAVDYVAGKFKGMGLKPAGTKGYLQPVKFESRLLVPDQSSLTLIRNGKEEPLALGSDANIAARADLAPKVEAPMVFVGYGLQIPEAHWDELAGVDLKGKIAIYVSAPSPAEAPAPVKSHLTSGAERWRMLHDAGAIGVATIAAGRGGAGGAARGGPPPDAAAAGRGAAGDAAGRGGRGGAPQPSVSLADPSLSETAGMQVSATLTQRGADKLFEGSGHTYAEIQELVRDNKPLPISRSPARCARKPPSNTRRWNRPMSWALSPATAS